MGFFPLPIFVDFGRIAQAIRDGLMNRRKRKLIIGGYFFRRTWFCLAQVVAIERPRRNISPFNEELLID